MCYNKEEITLESGVQPLMAQYFAIKDQYKDAVLMFQVGGFYQLYYHDAELAVQVLHTKRISRAIGGGKRAPMCGVPKSAVQKHAQALADVGYRVVICSQEIHADTGLAVRKVTQVLQPAAPQIDLTPLWEQYLADPALHAVQPPPRKKAARSDILDELGALNPAQMTPMEALQLLQDWQQRYLAKAE